MTAAVFVDTNVLVYARDASEPRKQPRAAAWMEHLWRARRGRISIQVLQEYYATVTGKLKPGLDRHTARARVRRLLAWRPVPMDAAVLEGAWSMQDSYSLSWWDALIVSAARVSDCRFLLSEDLPDGQSFGAVEVIDPFAHEPGDLPRSA
jgi:predicted nucleic acid-binding protein